MRRTAPADAAVVVRSRVMRRPLVHACALLLVLCGCVLAAAGAARAQDLAPGRVALRPDEVDKAASRRLRRVRNCYEEALDRSARSYGTIGVGMRVAPDGAVTERFVALSTLGDPKLEACILEAFEGIEFPAPGGFGAVVRFGILLKTDESPQAALLTQEEAYRNAIRDRPTIVPVDAPETSGDREAASPEPGGTPTLPGMEGLDDGEPFGPVGPPK